MLEDEIKNLLECRRQEHYLHHRKVIKCKTPQDLKKSWDFRRRKIRHSYIGDFHISTVFLVLDHGMSGISEKYPPLFFETMVFVNSELDHKLDGYTIRASNHRGALNNHRAVLKMVNQFIKIRT